MAERFEVPRDTVALAAERRPGEGPALVLLHAGVADRRGWTEVADALAARGAEVVSYDRRGFGETPPGGEPFRHLDDLRAVLDHVSRDPVWLVGSSQGGLVALDAALELPARLAGLVLLAPAVSGAPEPGEDELGEEVTAIDAAIEAADAAGDLDEVGRLEVRLWLDGPAAPEGRVGGAQRELALAMNLVALRSGLPEGAGASGLDAWARLEEVALPVSVAWGALDLPHVRVRCRELAARLPAVREVREWPGVAHLPSLEDPGAVAELVARTAGLAG